MYKETELDKMIKEVGEWAKNLKRICVVTCPSCEKEFNMQDDPEAYEYLKENRMCIGCEDYALDAQMEAKGDYEELHGKEEETIIW